MDNYRPRITNGTATYNHRAVTIPTRVSRFRKRKTIIHSAPHGAGPSAKFVQPRPAPIFPSKRKKCPISLLRGFDRAKGLSEEGEGDSTSRVR